MVELVLGTVNMGLPYGTALSRTLPSEAEVFAMLDAASALGVATLDTAAAYGASETRIGHHGRRGGPRFRISTKTPPDLDAAPDAALTEAVRAWQAAATRRLGRTRLDQVLIHRWSHRSAGGGALWEALLRLRQAGAIARLGASLQSPDEVAEALEDDTVETVQLACNLLDWRYDAIDMRPAAAPKDRRIELRSVFLQGLLTLADGLRVPRIAEDHDHDAVVRFLREAAGDLAGGDPVELCLRYAAGIDWADALVLGADTPSQLGALRAALDRGPYPPAVMAELRAARPRVPAALLDPSRWL